MEDFFNVGNTFKPFKMASFDADNLTDSELRSKLAEYGHPVGPVTETTRKILIKKLKLLMKQKNSVRNASRSLTRFSSGDESGSDTDQNGGNRSSRRISMPPPSGYKTTKRNSTPRNYTPDASPVPSISKVTCSTPLTPSRDNPDFKVSRFSSPTFTFKQPLYTAINRPTVTSSYSYDFDSGSDSDVADFKQAPSSTRKRTGLPFGSLSSYRSRLNSANSRNLFKTPTDSLSLRLKNNKKKDSRPFLSNFVGHFSRKSHLNDALNPLNIKETDVEEDGFTDKWRSVNIASRSFNFRDWIKPFRSLLQHLKSKESAVSSRYKSWNNSQLLSMLLLALFILFFIWLALAYFRVSQRAGIGGKSGNNYPLCKDPNEDKAGVLCIKRKKDLLYAVQMYKDVHLELQARGLRSLCGPASEDGSIQKPYMTEEEVLKFLLSKRSNDIGKIDIDTGIKNLKLLIFANRHWGISLLKNSKDFEPSINGYIPDSKLALPDDFEDRRKILFICQNVQIPWACYLSRLFYKVMFTTILVLLGVASVYGSYWVWKYYRKTKQEEHEQVMAMVEKILEHVSEASERANSGIDSNGSLTSLPQDYVAIRHVHDTLIHPTERQKMANIWRKAVKFIEENESRIRTEVQQVWGEDATVWRWLGPTLNKTQPSTPVSSESGSESNHLYPDLSSLKAQEKKGSDRVWQGEAFETSEGSMNSLPLSLTQCLKIRHMFKHDKDYGPDWVLKVKDAIVEKCEGARIVHLSVDKQSKEGCVYVKCATPQDAGIAYRQLHGSWFDGALVTVKYLRLERYHERFPDSIYARTPLRPSNNLRLSLQGTCSSSS